MRPVFVLLALLQCVAVACVAHPTPEANASALLESLKKRVLSRYDKLSNIVDALPQLHLEVSQNRKYADNMASDAEIFSKTAQTAKANVKFFWEAREETFAAKNAAASARRMADIAALLEREMAAKVGEADNKFDDANTKLGVLLDKMASVEGTNLDSDAMTQILECAGVVEAFLDDVEKNANETQEIAKKTRAAHGEALKQRGLAWKAGSRTANLANKMDAGPHQTEDDGDESKNREDPSDGKESAPAFEKKTNPDSDPADGLRATGGGEAFCDPNANKRPYKVKCNGAAAFAGANDKCGGGSTKSRGAADAEKVGPSNGTSEGEAGNAPPHASTISSDGVGERPGASARVSLVFLLAFVLKNLDMVW